MEFKITMPAKAIDALCDIAHELKELRLSLCPPLRGSRPIKPVDPKAPSRVQYPDFDPNKSYWDTEFPVERREDRG
jgi:hypothetical protein